jgi:RHS repeat-associated protein
MTGRTTGAANLITSDGTFNYQHDADGNQTVRTRISTSYATDHQTTYSWDYRNRLTDVQYYDNNGLLTKHVHYIYDVRDALIATQVDPTGSGSYTTTQRSVIEGGQPVLQFDNNGNLADRNLIAPNPAGVDAVMAQGAVSSRSQPDVVTWMLDDNLGSPRDEVNNNSAVVNHIVYSSFGQDVYESSSAYTHWAGFGGGHADVNTALTQNGHRWYDPSTGKWLSQDPSGFRGGDLNLSRYVGSEPTNAVDPSGLFAWGPDYYVDTTAGRQQYATWLGSGYDGNSSAPSTSWLDGYANWFNQAVPGGAAYTSAIGGFINTNAPAWVAPDNCSDGWLLFETTVVAVPTAFGLLYGGEGLLGVGTFYAGVNATAMSAYLYCQSTVYAGVVTASMWWNQLNMAPGAPSPAIGNLNTTSALSNAGYQILNVPSGAYNQALNSQWIQSVAGQPIMTGPGWGATTQLEWLQFQSLYGYQMYYPWLIQVNGQSY